MMTLGSLFDGSGGFPLGGLLAGITPVWASEIEPFPIRVTTKRLPFMKHYGNVSEMDGGKVEPVDIITFGSPCQDMSVAGKRAGLEGSRSNLFYEAVRIIKEMRKATGGEYPKWACWENVPGAFYSSGGEDFRCVLESLCGVIDESVSIPKPKKWANAGEILGDGYSLAWRVLDAQFWGVPQRRKRIYLVADFTGGCAGKVLFESEGLSGYTPQGFRSWQRTAGSTADCTGTASLCLNDQGGQRMDVTDDVTATLRAGVVPATVYENHSQDTRYTGPIDTAPTVSATYGMGGNNQPFVVSEETLKTLKIRSGCEGGGNPACNQGGIAVVAFAQNQRDEVRDLGEKSACLSAEPGMKQQTYVLRGNMIGRKDENGSQGSGVNEDVSFTLDATDCHTVAYGIDRIVRRLTPTECARLQGFPDWWCADLGTEKPSDEGLNFWRKVFKTYSEVTGCKMKSDKQIAKWLRDPHSDTAEYKMWGNGVALPCVWFVLCGIVWANG